MAREHCLRLVEPHHHEGGGIGIGGGAIVGDDGGGEDGVLHRIACGGVDGVGVFATVLVIEITIVAAGGHRLVGDVDDGLYLLIDIERIVGGLGDAYLPRQALLADAAGDYLAAYLYHIIVDALAPEIIGNNVAAIAFGYRTAVEHYPRVGLGDTTIGEAHLAIAYKALEAIHLMAGGHSAALEPKAPGIDERGYGDVERAIGDVGYFHGKGEHVGEHLVDRSVAVFIYCGDYRALVERREGGIHLGKLRLNFLLKVLRTLIGDVIYSAEHHALVVMIGCGALAADDYDRADDEERQKGQLPK